MENEDVTPLKPKFYQRYVHDILNQYKKNIEDILFKGSKLIIDRPALSKKPIHLYSLTQNSIALISIVQDNSTPKTTNLPINWSYKVL